MRIYPVVFRDFLKISRVGEYIIMYTILDDRVHFEMVAEANVFCSQKFIKDIEDELKEKADNYIGDPIDFYIRMICSMKTYYKFYPTDEEIEKLKNIKLYNELEVNQITPGVYDKNKVKFSESDNVINALSGENVIFSAMKIT